MITAPGQTPGRVSDTVAGRSGPSPGIWVGAAVVSTATTVMWLHGTPSGRGAVLVGIGQLTGFACSLCALATVLFMARVPALEAWLGTARGLAWHRRSATAMIGFLVVHALATVLGYAAADNAGAAAEVSKLLGHYPDMLTATVGSVLLLGVSVTSIRVVRKWLHYETWLFAHWYVYPALLLVFGHELSDGSAFVHASIATLAWTWFHVMVLVALVWYRVALPAWRVLAHPLRVTSVERAGPKAVHVTLDGDALDTFGAKAGQHLRLRFMVPGGWYQSHPYSLSACPTGDAFRLTIVAEGDFGERLLSLRPGTRVLATGAHGNLTAARRLTDRVTLIGGGSGIVPLRAILEDLPTQVAARVLYRVRDQQTAVLATELEALAARRGSVVDIVHGRRNPNASRDVLSPPGLLRLFPGIDGDDVFVCGSASFVDTVCRSLTSLGVPAVRQHTERFDA